MMNDVLTLSATGPAPPGGTTEYWISMTTDPPEETSSISKEDLARWLDSVYGIVEHCTGEKSADAYSPSDPEDTTETRLQGALSGEKCSESASQLGLPAACAVGRRLGDSITETVYVHWSDPDTIGESYTFKATSDISPSGPSRGRKTISVVIDFTDTDYAPIKRYADADAVADIWKDNPPEFLGNVLVGQAIVDRKTIGVGWSNGRITLTQPVSGRLTFLLPIQYDVWTVSVPGVIVGNKRNYTATAYAFSYFLTEPAEVELSDEIEDPAEGSDCDLCGGSTDPLGKNADGSTVVNSSTRPCQLRTDWEIRNKCDTSIIIDSGTTYADTPCPSKRVRTVSYSDAQTPESAKITDEKYTEDCCVAPTIGCVPECREITSTWAGGVPAQPSEEYYRSKYPNSVVTFVYVRPQGGCGERRDKFVAGNCNDCEGIIKLVWSENNPDIIAPGGSVILEVTGGDPVAKPITWTLQGGGTGYTLTGGGTSYVNGRSVEVFASVEVCGPTTVKADDGCSTASGPLKHTGGVAIDYTTVGELRDGRVYNNVYLVTGSGTPPYTYRSTGSWRFGDGAQVIVTTSPVVSVYLDLASCDEGTLTVEDDCSSDFCALALPGATPVSISYTTAGCWSGKTYVNIYLVPGSGWYPFVWTCSGEWNFGDGSQEVVAGGSVSVYSTNPSAGFTVTVTSQCNTSQTQQYIPKPDIVC